jgi:hypothetical protein
VDGETQDEVVNALCRLTRYQRPRLVRATGRDVKLVALVSSR